MAGKVVIVDDDRETREHLSAVLEENGFEVVLAQNGLRLISYLHVDRPDVILLDVVMSWIDGFELCRALRRNPEYDDIPLCFISGRSDPDAIVEGLRCGADAYLVKPIDPDELVRKVTELVQQSSERRGRQ